MKKHPKRSYQITSKKGINDDAPTVEVEVENLNINDNAIMSVL
jgi:hypothetical protein